MKRGLCGECYCPVTFVSVRGRRAKDNGMWVHDNADCNVTRGFKPHDHDVVEAVQITAA